MEPTILRRGKEFHRMVQRVWSGTIEDAPVHSERSLSMVLLSPKGKGTRRGRIDIFVDKIEDFVTVIEIKSTDWDAVKPRNLTKLLGAHRRQVLEYVDEYLEGEGINVCAGIIYPHAPATPGRKERVESYLNSHALQVAWFYSD